MAKVPRSYTLDRLSDGAAPGRALVKLTKNDDADLPDGPCRALHVGTAGTATFVDLFGNTCTDFPLKEGLNPYSIKRLKTGGTADDIWGVY